MDMEFVEMHRLMRRNVRMIGQDLIIPLGRIWISFCLSLTYFVIVMQGNESPPWLKKHSNSTEPGSFLFEFSSGTLRVLYFDAPTVAILYNLVFNIPQLAKDIWVKVDRGLLTFENVRRILTRTPVGGQTIIYFCGIVLGLIYTIGLFYITPASVRFVAFLSIFMTDSLAQSFGRLVFEEPLRPQIDRRAHLRIRLQPVNRPPAH